MPYDPQQMMAISRLGLNMAQPQPSFQDPVQAASGRAPGRPKQWWEQMPPQQGGGAPAGPTGQSANSPNSQMTLLDMLMQGNKLGKSMGTAGGMGKGGSDLGDRPSLGPIPSMGMANMPASMWSQFTGMFPGGGGWGGGAG